ncbi:hypothetical protein IMX07_00865 [bacterium]|nr:hypothetical protein [bacterium]
MGVLPLHRRVREAAHVAQAVAGPWLAADGASDPAAWAVRASDWLADFTESGALADLQRAAAATLCALAIELHRGRGVPPKELARVGRIIGEEVVEAVEREIAQVDAAIAAAPRGSRRALYGRRAMLQREKARICAALREKTERIEEAKA